MSGLVEFVAQCVTDNFTGDNAQIAELILADEDFFTHICKRLKDEFGDKNSIQAAVAAVAADLNSETDEFGDNGLRDWVLDPDRCNSPTGWFKRQLGV